MRVSSSAYTLADVFRMFRVSVVRLSAIHFQG